MDEMGIPTLFVCPNRTAVHYARPKNLSDPYLKEWIIESSNPVEGVYIPDFVPGYWDVSGYRGYDGVYRLVSGSCHKSGGSGAYCGDNNTPGNPQIMVLESPDMKSWKYVGQVWTGKNTSFGPRIECPQMMDRGLVSPKSGLVGVLSSYPGTFQNALHVGYPKGNGSSIEYISPTEGYILDFGVLYAGQTMYDPEHERRLYWGWIVGTRSCGRLCDGNDWKGALSLPRQISIRDDGSLIQDVAPEINALRVTPAYHSGPLHLEPGEATEVDIPQGLTVEMEVLIDGDLSGGSILVRTSEDMVEYTRISYTHDFGLMVCSVSANEPTDRLPYQPSCASAPPKLRKPKPNNAKSNANNSDFKSSEQSGRRNFIRIYVDVSVLEVHVNREISLTYRMYPTAQNASGVYVVNSRHDCGLSIRNLTVWGMASAYQP
ncbi:hypothetical protein AAMO2058_001645500 [Amorphochlora amoebiformis]